MKTFDAGALPAIALTAYARTSDRERALAAGFVQYVVKPVDPEELLKVIGSVVEAS
jgi:CheY-like chemotaxis protein